MITGVGDPKLGDARAEIVLHEDSDAMTDASVHKPVGADAWRRPGRAEMHRAGCACGSLRVPVSLGAELSVPHLTPAGPPAPPASPAAA
jgi:hypothetical protein